MKKENGLYEYAPFKIILTKIVKDRELDPHS
jgi:hypothetical protein